ncbi:MAG: transposase [Actinobacteria bacterium]|nr:transposase [Actinomycetota bacterium]
MRSTAVLRCSYLFLPAVCIDVVGSGRRDLAPYQRAELKPNEAEAPAPHFHAEITVLKGATERGLVPLAMGVCNGTTPKTVHTELGDLRLDMPRDRNSEFEPQILPKGQTHWDGFDDRITRCTPAG